MKKPNSIFWLRKWKRKKKLKELLREVPVIKTGETIKQPRTTRKKTIMPRLVSKKLKRWALTSSEVVHLDSKTPKKVMMYLEK